MSEPNNSLNDKNKNQLFLRLKEVKAGQQVRSVYSSASHSRSSTIKSDQTRFNSLDRANKTQTSNTKWGASNNN